LPIATGLNQFKRKSPRWRSSIYPANLFTAIETLTASASWPGYSLINGSVTVVIRFHGSTIRRKHRAASS
jgi:hypothetical protein